MKSWHGSLAACFASTLFAACTPPVCRFASEPGVADAGSEDGSHVHPESPVPAQFQDLVNPNGYPASAAVLAAGQAVYRQQCSRCHGDDGHARGADVPVYCPPVDDLNDANRRHPDPYLYWRIYVGGTDPSFRTDMPGFGTALSETDLWNVISYVRATFIEF